MGGPIFPFSFLTLLQQTTKNTLGMLETRQTVYVMWCELSVCLVICVVHRNTDHKTESVRVVVRTVCLSCDLCCGEHKTDSVSFVVRTVCLSCDLCCSPQHRSQDRECACCGEKL
jgi:hypothetical protein